MTLHWPLRRFHYISLPFTVSDTVRKCWMCCAVFLPIWCLTFDLELLNLAQLLSQGTFCTNANCITAYIPNSYVTWQLFDFGLHYVSLMCCTFHIFRVFFCCSSLISTRRSLKIYSVLESFPSLEEHGRNTADTELKQCGFLKNRTRL